MIDQLNDHLTDTGIFVRGGFHPHIDDQVPALPDGKSAKTVILVGNAGTELWHEFKKQADLSVPHPLDSWVRSKIKKASRLVGAFPVLPNEGPPFVPIQEWATRAEPVFRSPIGIMIHPVFGLWHVYRAALLFSEKTDLPKIVTAEHPCETCVKRPCLSVCPVDAFLPDRFEANKCASHVKSARGSHCRERGCLARRACPVGRKYLYDVSQQAFHTEAMLRAVEKGFGN